MPQYYIYLISSLTILQFDAKPPFSFAQFLEICADKIPQDDFDILKTASTSGKYPVRDTRVPSLNKWRQFDTALRNELAKIRSLRRHIDPAKYLRSDGEPDLFITHIVAGAYKNPSILEAEQMLDQARWQTLDELSLGHYFDLDFLIIYAHKLLILERWQRIHTANGAEMLEVSLQ